MSASWSTSQDRRNRTSRAYRRPRRSAVPVEIDTQGTTRSHASSHQHSVVKSHHDKQQLQADTRNSKWEPSKKRIEILPGSLLMPQGEPWLHPPEPTNAPPMPMEILQFLILGECNAGKTTLCRRFQQQHCTHVITNNNESFKRKPSREWSVEYHKKDVTFWRDEKTVACARVQLWDVTGGGPSNEQPLTRRQEWLGLLQKMSGMILVVSLEYGPTLMLDTIQSWKHWLDECTSHMSQVPPVYLFLQKCDLLPSQAIEPLVWIELGSRISRLCQDVGIEEWYMTTCTTESSDQSPEEAIMKILQSLVTTFVPQKKVSFEAKSATKVERPGRRATKLA